MLYLKIYIIYFRLSLSLDIRSTNIFLRVETAGSVNSVWVLTRRARLVEVKEIPCNS